MWEDTIKELQIEKRQDGSAPMSEMEITVKLQSKHWRYKKWGESGEIRKESVLKKNNILEEKIKPEDFQTIKKKKKKRKRNKKKKK